MHHNPCNHEAERGIGTYEMTWWLSYKLKLSACLVTHCNHFQSRVEKEEWEDGEKYVREGEKDIHRLIHKIAINYILTVLIVWSHLNFVPSLTFSKDIHVFNYLFS